MVYIWEIFRPLSDLAWQFDPVIKIFVLVLAFGFFVVSLLAYRRAKSKKLLLVSLAFFLFAVKWLIKVFDIFFSPGTFLSDSSENVFEFSILVLLFLAVFRR